MADADEPIIDRDALEAFPRDIEPIVDWLRCWSSVLLDGPSEYAADPSQLEPGLRVLAGAAAQRAGVGGGVTADRRRGPRRGPESDPTDQAAPVRAGRRPDGAAAGHRGFLERGVLGPGPTLGDESG